MARHELDEHEAVLLLAIEGIREFGRTVGTALSLEDAAIYAHGALSAIRHGGFKIVRLDNG